MLKHLIPPKLIGLWRLFRGRTERQMIRNRGKRIYRRWRSPTQDDRSYNARACRMLRPEAVRTINNCGAALGGIGVAYSEYGELGGAFLRSIGAGARAEQQRAMLQQQQIDQQQRSLSYRLGMSQCGLETAELAKALGLAGLSQYED